MGIEVIIGGIGAIFIGFSMGMMGGGGSILSIPILAYLFHFDEKTATAYSLFIVGFTALFGGIRKLFSGLVSFKTVLMFGLPAVVGVTLIRRFVVPALPDIIFHVGAFEVSRRMLIFGLFSLLMFLTAYSMLQKTKTPIPDKKPVDPEFHPLIITEGLFTGALMGLIGAGGGFLIVPALMLIAKLPMKKAVATSLAIISINSLMGFFLGDFFQMEVDWNFLLIFLGLSFFGILLGNYFTKFINNELLKKWFAYFILVMAIFIFIMEFVLI